MGNSKRRIEVDFKPGDTAYLLIDNDIKEYIIDRVKISRDYCVYYYHGYSRMNPFTEEDNEFMSYNVGRDVFNSREAAIEAVINTVSN